MSSGSSNSTVKPYTGPPRGLFISSEELEPMDLAVCSAPFTGYLPTSTEIKFRCLKQMPISMLDINFFRKHLLNKRSVPWTVNFSLSFPDWNSPHGSCVYPMGADASYTKTDGEAISFPSTVGADIRLHILGLVTLPLVLYGVALTIQCLLVDKMYFIPLPNHIDPTTVPLLLDARIFNGRKVPFKVSVFSPTFYTRPGTPELCLASRHTPDGIDVVLCLSVSAACIEYGKHLEEVDERTESHKPKDTEDIDEQLYPENHECLDGSRKPHLNNRLIGRRYCGAGIFFSQNSQFNRYICLDDGISTPHQAELQSAIEGLKAVECLSRYTGYSFHTAVILTASRLVYEGIKNLTQVSKWAANNWKTDNGHHIEDSSLWNELLTVARDVRYRIDWELVNEEPESPAAVLARKAALDNIFIDEESHSGQHERRITPPSQFKAIKDAEAGPLYDRFVDKTASETTGRTSAVIYEGGICTDPLPRGFYSIMNCANCGKIHSYPPVKCEKRVAV